MPFSKRSLWQKGAINILGLLGLAFLLVSLAVSVRLVQQRQETRRLAVYPSECDMDADEPRCEGTVRKFCVDGKWQTENCQYGCSGGGCNSAPPTGCPVGCCGGICGSCPSGQSCDIPNAACSSGFSCNPAGHGYHKACRDNQCVNVPGQGSDECTSDSQCQVQPQVCQPNQCCGANVRCNSAGTACSVTDYSCGATQVCWPGVCCTEGFKCNPSGTACDVADASCTSRFSVAPTPPLVAQRPSPTPTPVPAPACRQEGYFSLAGQCYFCDESLGTPEPVGPEYCGQRCRQEGYTLVGGKCYFCDETLQEEEVPLSYCGIKPLCDMDVDQDQCVNENMRKTCVDGQWQFTLCQYGCQGGVCKAAPEACVFRNRDECDLNCGPGCNYSGGCWGCPVTPAVTPTPSPLAQRDLLEALGGLFDEFGRSLYRMSYHPDFPGYTTAWLPGAAPITTPRYPTPEENLMTAGGLAIIAGIPVVATSPVWAPAAGAALSSGSIYGYSAVSSAIATSPLWVQKAVQVGIPVTEIGGTAIAAYECSQGNQYACMAGFVGGQAYTQQAISTAVSQPSVSRSSSRLPQPGFRTQFVTEEEFWREELRQAVRVVEKTGAKVYVVPKSAWSEGNQSAAGLTQWRDIYLAPEYSPRESLAILAHEYLHTKQNVASFGYQYSTLGMKLGEEIEAYELGARQIYSSWAASAQQRQLLRVEKIMSDTSLPLASRQMMALQVLGYDPSKLKLIPLESSSWIMP